MRPHELRDGLPADPALRRGKAVRLSAARAYARREAHRILAASWDDVLRIADVLVSRNLGGAEIRRLMGQRGEARRTRRDLTPAG